MHHVRYRYREVLIFMKDSSSLKAVSESAGSLHVGRGTQTTRRNSGFFKGRRKDFTVNDEVAGIWRCILQLFFKGILYKRNCVRRDSWGCL